MIIPDYRRGQFLPRTAGAAISYRLPSPSDRLSDRQPCPYSLIIEIPGCAMKHPPDHIPIG